LNKQKYFAEGQHHKPTIASSGMLGLNQQKYFAEGQLYVSVWLGLNQQKSFADGHNTQQSLSQSDWS
jgi:hypothetical protein